MNNKFPWKEAISVYDNAGPEKEELFTINNIGFIVAPTNDAGRDTGRRRYKVDCVDCDYILHPSTTGPSSHVAGHMREKHGMEWGAKIGYEQ